MKIDTKKLKYISLIVLLAAFHFVFLGTEYLFDDKMAILVNSKNVVLSQGYVLGASVLGYLLYYFVYKLRDHLFLYRALFVCAGAAYVACIKIIVSSSDYKTILFAGIVCFILLGTLGSASCFYVSFKIPNSSYLARIIGFSYAIGVGIQFLNNNYVKGFFAQSIFLCILAILFIAILLSLSKEKQEIESAISASQFRNTLSVRSALLLVSIIVILLTCIFSTLDNAVTLVHSDGTFNIGQWPRLFLAASGLAAGFLYDIQDRKHMNNIMYSIAILALISLVIMGFGGSFLVGLIIFYISAAFFVVYFMTSYMTIARFSEAPALWSGMGRAVNNLVSVLISLSSVTLLLNNMMMIIIISILLISILSYCMMLYQKKCYFDEEIFGLSLELSALRENAKSAKSTLTEEERMASFSQKYGLTDRETEVVSVLIQSEDSIQDMARELALSRTALYRHISSIQEKVGANSRIGIIRCFYQDNL